MRTDVHQQGGTIRPKAPVLSDLGRPALVIGSEVRWMMTDGREHIRACTPVDCLVSLDGGKELATLECFERHRGMLSGLAAAVFARRESDGSQPVRVEKSDIETAAD